MTLNRIAIARDRALNVLEKNAIVAPWVPVERLVKAEGALLQFVPLDDELSGMAFDKAGQPTIVINALHHPNRQRFTMAHELAHVLLHRDQIAREVHVDKDIRVAPQGLKRDALAALGIDSIEMEANAFASELLMPKKWVTAELQGGWDIDDEKIGSLAKKFKVSPAAMQFRLMDLLSQHG